MSFPTPVIFDLVINEAGEILAGGVSVHRFGDNGQTWEKMGMGLVNPIAGSLAVSASGPMLAGTGGSGVFRTIDR